MSKKAFKMNVGMLYKLKLISIEEDGIRLIPETKLDTSVEEVPTE
jgi:hypothetical protein